MTPRTAATCALIAASMLGMVYDRHAGTRERSERWDPHTPKSSREKQAKNKYRRRKGKR